MHGRRACISNSIAVEVPNSLQKNTTMSTLLLILSVSLIAVHAKVDIRFAYFTSGPEGGFDSSGSVPAVEIAQEQILRNTTILNGYRLSHTAVQDTMCNRTLSLNKFLKMIPFSNPPVLGLLGCGCSLASEPVAEIIHHWNISQIAYGSASIILSESRFRSFFRTYPSDDNIIPAISSVIEFYRWRRVAFITQEENLFTDTFSGIQKRLAKQDITTLNRLVSSDLPVRELQNLDFFFQSENIRVFFINTYSDIARVIICEAYKQGFTSPRYVWLTYGWYQDRWWTEEVNAYPINCTDDQLSGFVDRILAVQVFPTALDSNARTDTGLTPYEFDQLYRERLNTSEAEMNNYTYTFVGTLAYDATWALALALDKTAAMVNDTSEEIFNKTGCRDEVNQLVPLENFTYDNGLMGCVTRYHLQNTYFRGVSGDVHFDASGTRVQSQIKVLQYRLENSGGLEEFERVVFGFSNGSQFSYLNNESSDTVFPGGVPHDGTPIPEIVTFHLALVITYAVLAGVGIAFTTLCLVFNCVFRKRKVVLLTSPKLNYFILAGAYIMYTSTIIRIIPTTNETFVFYQCSLDMFLVTIGYCMAFSTVLAKMGRVYQIFHNPVEKKKNLAKDRHLILVILGISSAGLLLAILGWAVPHLRSKPVLVANEEKSTGINEFGVQINYLIWKCYDSSNRAANGFIYGKLAYFALLQVIGLVLAIQTRKVSVKLLNDSKYVAALTYITSITLIVVGLGTYTLRDYLHVGEAIYSGGILAATTSFLCLIFIPKMISLYRDPKGENVFQKRSQPSIVEVRNSGAGFTFTRAGTENGAEKISQLEARIRQLERQRDSSNKEDVTSTQMNGVENRPQEPGCLVNPHKVQSC